jgi:hypothetical protein
MRVNTHLSMRGNAHPAATMPGPDLPKGFKFNILRQNRRPN